jgi:hypothetical protein
MMALCVVVLPPPFDLDAGLRAIPKPLDRQTLVPELAVEGFVGAILPGLARIDEGCVDVRGLEPLENRRRDELGAVVRPEIAWGVKGGAKLDHGGGGTLDHLAAGLSA